MFASPATGINDDKIRLQKGIDPGIERNRSIMVGETTKQRFGVEAPQVGVY